MRALTFVLITAITCGYLALNPGDWARVRKVATESVHNAQFAAAIPAALDSLPQEIRDAHSDVTAALSRAGSRLQSGLREFRRRWLDFVVK